MDKIKKAAAEKILGEGPGAEWEDLHGNQWEFERISPLEGMITCLPNKTRATQRRYFRIKISEVT